MSAAKWEKRYHKQVEANNLLSEKLRKTRIMGRDLINTLQQSYKDKVKEVQELRHTVLTLEEIILKDARDAEITTK